MVAHVSIRSFERTGGGAHHSGWMAEIVFLRQIEQAGSGSASRVAFEDVGAPG